MIVNFSVPTSSSTSSASSASPSSSSTLPPPSNFHASSINFLIALSFPLLLVLLASPVRCEDPLSFKGNCPPHWSESEDLDKVPAFDFMARLGLDPHEGDALNVRGAKVVKGTRPPFNAIQVSPQASLKV